jgi:hypothetical protein
VQRRAHWVLAFSSERTVKRRKPSIVIRDAEDVLDDLAAEREQDAHGRQRVLGRLPGEGSLEWRSLDGSPVRVGAALRSDGAGAVATSVDRHEVGLSLQGGVVRHFGSSSALGQT